MVPFSRTIRTRVRRLPKPPSQSNQTANKYDTANVVSRSIYIDNENLKRFTQENKGLKPVVEKTESKILSQLNSSLNGKKNVLSELGEILKEGSIAATLEKIVPEPVQGDIDYSKIRKSQYKKAVQDYRAAGKTFSNSGLFSNASISYTCAVLSQLLATQSIQHAYLEFQDIVSKVQDKQIIKSSVFSLLTNLFESMANKDSVGIKKQLDKFKLIETFSSDDQELINDSIKMLWEKTRIEDKI